MTPTDFPQANIVHRANRNVAPNAVDTPQFCAPGTLVLCFQPDDREVAAISAGAPVWLVVMNYSNGAVSHGLTTVSPWMAHSKLT